MKQFITKLTQRDLYLGLNDVDTDVDTNLIPSIEKVNLENEWYHNIPSNVKIYCLYSGVLVRILNVKNLDKDILSQIDFYAVVTIDGLPMREATQRGKDEIEPYWTSIQLYIRRIFQR
jgi:hypothetical protein